MSREWKPGDVALVQYDSEGLIGLVRPRIEANRRLEFAYVNAGFDMVDDPDVAALARPLVVIDPEDREQVERIYREQERAIQSIREANPEQVGISLIDALQVGLRRMLDPECDPKPAEPTGLGAVVEDAEGVRWVLLDGPALPDEEWYSGHHNARRTYADINAVRVLSEGVTA